MSDRTKLIASLRHVANVLGQNPLLPAPYFGTAITRVENLEQMIAVGKSYGGFWEKSTTDDDFQLRRTFSDALSMMTYTARENVCTRIVVGTKVIPATTLPAREEKFQARVTHLEQHRIWKSDEDLDIGWLIQRIRGQEETDKMRAGTAFHKVMEGLEAREHNVLTTDDYRFDILCDIDLVLPTVSEIAASRVYGDLLVTGRLDGLRGRVVTEFKTTERFDADRYFEGLQWRFYLDMTGADRFDWHVFQMSERAPKTYEIYQYHQLTQFRYNGLRADCEKAAADYLVFAQKFLPETRAA
jgi:hypothetical protein